MSRLLNVASAMLNVGLAALDRGAELRRDALGEEVCDHLERPSFEGALLRFGCRGRRMSGSR